MLGADSDASSSLGKPRGMLMGSRAGRARRSIRVAALGFVVSSILVTGTASSGAAAKAKPEIDIMLTATLQSSLISRPHSEDGAKAAAAAIFEKDGVKINITACNDNNDPNIALACARQAVSDQLDAVIGGTSQHSVATYPLLEAAKIPFFGPTPIVDGDFQSPVAFPLVPGLAAGAVAQAEVSAKHGCKKAAVLSGDNSASTIQGDTFAEARDALGLESTKISVPTTAADLAPYVAQALDSNPDCVSISLPGATRAIVAVKQSSTPTMPLIAGASVVTQAVRAALGTQLEGIWVVSQAVIADSPDLSQFHAQMAAYSPDQTLVDDDALFGWSNVYAVYQAAKAVKGELTSAKLLAAGNKMTLVNEAFPEPIDFTAKSPVKTLPRLRNTVLTEYTVENGEVVQVGKPIDARKLLKKISSK